MVSLPIPSHADKRRLRDLRFEGTNLGALVPALTNNRITAQQVVHLDPDIYVDLVDRAPGWRPAFGQSGIAQSHLANQGVGVGDVFLFYGWFRRLESTFQGLRYAVDAEDMHVIYGWLQVGEVWPIVRNRKGLLAHYPSQIDHPHVASPSHYTDRRNTLYLATDRLHIPGLTHCDLAGGAAIRRYSDHLKLTETGQTRSFWRMPSWCWPSAGKPPLTYHGNPKRWVRRNDHVLLKTVGRGQEFVLDAEAYPEAQAWLVSLLRPT